MNEWQGKHIRINEYNVFEFFDDRFIRYISTAKQGLYIGSMYDLNLEKKKKSVSNIKVAIMLDHAFEIRRANTNDSTGSNGTSSHSEAEEYQSIFKQRTCGTASNVYSILMIENCHVEKNAFSFVLFVLNKNQSSLIHIRYGVLFYAA